MTLHRSIFFDSDKIVENSKIKLSYSGELFQKGAEEVIVHYGFGLLWSNVSESKMIKTELGFETEIDVPNTDLINFCFKDEHSNWDNNEGHNFSFAVEKNELVIAKTSDIDMFKPRLTKGYLFSRRMKLLFYKLITAVPKVINGTYKKKVKGVPLMDTITNTDVVLG